MINIVALTGRLTADPELRETTKGIKVTSFTIAVPRSYVKPNENVLQILQLLIDEMIIENEGFKYYKIK